MEVDIMKMIEKLEALHQMWKKQDEDYHNTYLENIITFLSSQLNKAYTQSERVDKILWIGRFYVENAGKVCSYCDNIIGASKSSECKNPKCSYVKHLANIDKE